MLALIGRIFRLIGFVAATLLGMAMALVFICSTLIAVTALLITGRLTGRPSAAKEYFKRAQASRKPLWRGGPFGDTTQNKGKDIIDVEAKEIK